MNKKALSFLLGVSVVAAACGFVSKNKAASGSGSLSANDDISKQPIKNGNDENLRLTEGPSDPVKPGDSGPSEPGTDNPSPPPEKPVTQWDSKALDDKVTEQAKLLGKDPKTYRMLTRTDPDGAKIYRMLGMFVIVNPNGEESFLPDEL